MGGPRVTSGKDSKQDYQTPNDFMLAMRRFGPLEFDLAAHTGNHKHERYFAPKTLKAKLDFSKNPESNKEAIEFLIRCGSDRSTALAAYKRAEEDARSPDAKAEVEIEVPNSDREAVAFDAFAHSWADLSLKYKFQPTWPDGSPSGTFNPGLLWLNCEFSDIAPWARRCMEEMSKGANIALLVPAMTGANWYRDLIAGKADVYHLNGRLCFDGKNVYPKDCMLCHYHPAATGSLYIWDWKRDNIVVSWERKVQS